MGRKKSQQSSNCRLSSFHFTVDTYDVDFHIYAYLTYNDHYCVDDVFTGGEVHPASYNQNGVPPPDAASWRRSSHMDIAQQQQGLQRGHFYG